MSTINSISGSPEALQISQVEKQARPEKEKDPVKNVESTVPPDSSSDLKNLRTSVSATVTNEKPVSYEQVKEVADKLQSRIDDLSDNSHKVAIHTDEKTDQFVIEIKTADGQVVKQFPPEKVLNMYERMDDLSGMVIDEMT